MRFFRAFNSSETDRWTDKASYRVACPQPKMKKKKQFSIKADTKTKADVEFTQPNNLFFLLTLKLKSVLKFETALQVDIDSRTPPLEGCLIEIDKCSLAPPTLILRATNPSFCSFVNC